MKTALWLVVAALVAWLAWSEMRPPDPAIDNLRAARDSLVATLDRTRAEVERQKAASDSAVARHARAQEEWAEERERLTARARAAGEEASRLATRLRETMTVQQQAGLDSLMAAWDAERGYLVEWGEASKAEAEAANQGWAAERARSALLWDRLEVAKAALDASEAVTVALERENARIARMGRITKIVAAAGWAVAALK